MPRDAKQDFQSLIEIDFSENYLFYSLGFNKRHRLFEKTNGAFLYDKWFKRLKNRYIIKFA